MENFLFVVLILLTIFFFIEIRRSLLRSKKTVELIDKYWNDKNSPMLIQEIFLFATNDRRLSSVVNKYNASQSDFSNIITLG